MADAGRSGLRSNLRPYGVPVVALVNGLSLCSFLFEKADSKRTRNPTMCSGNAPSARYVIFDISTARLNRLHGVHPLPINALVLRESGDLF